MMKVVALINITAIGALTFLAWHFDKWWLILLAPLIMVGYKQKGVDEDDDLL